MKLWLRKLFVITVAVSTFGIIVPSHTPAVDQNRSRSDVINPSEQDNVNISKIDIGYDDLIVEEFRHPLKWTDIAQSTTKDDLSPQFTAFTIQQAEQLAMTKFGQSIRDNVENEFRAIILPKIEEVLDTLAIELEEDQLRNIEITEQPSGGLGEKIFHLFDVRTGKDIVRFHVRRDQPPLDGYWFNFHYHKQNDNFQGHYELGKIYWDKNTPPHWMS